MQTTNSTMNLAKKNKRDEFYTRIEDIDKEIKYWEKYLENKVVYCNCDNPLESNFFSYFVLNFDRLKLKKIYCTCYAEETIECDIFGDTFSKNDNELPYIAEIDKQLEGVSTIEEVKAIMKKDVEAKENKYINILNDSGSFNSDECVEILKKSDIVISNPPFSLLTEYISFIINHNKDLLILGNITASKNPETLNLFKENKLFYGKSTFNNGMYFYVPDDYEYADNYNFEKEIDGKKVLRVSSICWYTTLFLQDNAELELTEIYNSENYPKYDNYNAINVDNVNLIPKDYFYEIGVPITFLNKWNRNQFKIIECLRAPKLNGKDIYCRIIIKRK